MPSESSRGLRPIGRRKYIRFSAEAKTLAQIGFQEDSKDFKPEHVGLVVNEGYKGCAVVFRIHADFQPQRTCVIKCGLLDPMKARISRVQALDSDVIRVGIEYLS
jgi:hypothetical protein